MGLAATGRSSLQLTTARTRGPVARVRQELGLTFRLIPDPDRAIARRYRVNCWPSTVAVNEAGRIDWVHFGMTPGAGRPNTSDLSADRSDTTGQFGCTSQLDQATAKATNETATNAIESAPCSATPRTRSGFSRVDSARSAPLRSCPRCKETARPGMGGGPKSLRLPRGEPVPIQPPESGSGSVASTLRGDPAGSARAIRGLDGPRNSR